MNDFFVFRSNAVLFDLFLNRLNFFSALLLSCLMAPPELVELPYSISKLSICFYLFHSKINTTSSESLRTIARDIVVESRDQLNDDDDDDRFC